MAEFGTLTIYLVLVLATWSGALALMGARSRSMSKINAARLMLYATAVVSSVAVVVLAYAFAVSDFSLDYVHRFSDRTMPVFYKLTAVWGGQEGSLLLWTWLLAVFAAWSVHVNQERLRELLPYIILALVAVIIFFCVLLLQTNPFSTFLIEVPTVGRGLNPLLQNAYMVTHPPALYLGYVGMVVPFAFAVGALIAGQTDESWILAARPWALASWYFLTMGNVLGMLWAYEELGWGGFWAWDPVENAGLIPWLTSTAYIHSVMVQERRQMLKVWNIVLAILTFELTIFGTFLTRSGFIQSVHAFAKSEVGWYFLGFMALVAIVTIALIAWRMRLLRSRGRLESVLSREFSFVINNWVLLSAAFLVMVLTLFPSISQIFGNKINISAPAFNRWMVPIGMALLVLTGLGPMLGWRKSTGTGLRRQFMVPAIVGVTLIVALVALGVRGALPLATFGVCGFVVVTVFQELVRGVMIRRRATKTDPLTAFITLIARNRRRYGGYVVHLGVVLMYLGFAGEAYKVEGEFEMVKGQQAKIGRYTLRFDGARRHQDNQKEMVTATLSVFLEDKTMLGAVKPARWVYFKHKDQPTSEVGIKRSAREDLFVVIGGFSDDLSKGTFKAIINPLVNWIWIGFILMTIGAVITLIPARVRVRRAAVAAAVLLCLTGGVANAQVTPEDKGHTPTIAVKQTTEQERRVFSKLVCLCESCPRLPLSTCQCGFAQKERAAIRKKLAAGLSDEQILAWYMKDRGPELGRPPFEATALTVPPDTGFNRISWLLPYALSGLFAAILIFVGIRWARSRGDENGQVTAAREQAEPPAVDNADPEAKHGDLDEDEGDQQDDQNEAYDDLLDRELRKLD